MLTVFIYSSNTLLYYAINTHIVMRRWLNSGWSMWAVHCWLLWFKGPGFFSTYSLFWLNIVTWTFLVSQYLCLWVIISIKVIGLWLGTLGLWGEIKWHATKVPGHHDALCWLRKVFFRYTGDQSGNDKLAQTG